MKQTNEQDENDEWTKEGSSSRNITLHQSLNNSLIDEPHVTAQLLLLT